MGLHVASDSMNATVTEICHGYLLQNVFAISQELVWSHCGMHVVFNLVQEKCITEKLSADDLKGADITDQ